MYVSALQLPISAFSKALDCKDCANERNVSSLTNCRVQPILCKGTEKKQNGIKKTIVLFVTYHSVYLQPIITQYFIDNKSEIWLLFLIAHSKR